MIQDHPVADVVQLGSEVSVRDEEGERQSFTIVGSVEADPRHGRISNESPVGRALLGKRVGDTAVVVAPGGSFNLEVLEVK
jgi:transcription elongation factor GreA